MSSYYGIQTLRASENFNITGITIGSRSGLNETTLPAKQPGSSIMPGKVNPVIPEVVN